jgi:hypothetical protein
MKFLYPYKAGSAGAKALSQALGIKRIKHKNSKFKGRPNKTVINWGNGSLPEQVMLCNVINKPECVNNAGNKLSTFKEFERFNMVQGIPHDHMEEEEVKRVNYPDFTEDADVASGWLDDGLVVARTVLRGHSGDGIHIINRGDDIVPAPLYVKYIKKTQEYRVHILNNEVIDQQRKARKKDVADEEVNWQIRNHDNGFIFMREGVDLPEVAIKQATYALQALGLDFGAVDLIYNEKQDKYYVLEVNTAPGLTGTTLDNCKEAFNDI